MRKTLAILSALIAAAFISCGKTPLEPAFKHHRVYTGEFSRSGYIGYAVVDLPPETAELAQPPMVQLTVVGTFDGVESEVPVATGTKGVHSIAFQRDATDNHYIVIITGFPGQRYILHVWW